MSESALTLDEAKEGCGVGTERCCVYVVAGPGFFCGRVVPGLKAHLDARRPHMRAQRAPIAPYPECQKEASDE